MALVGCSSVRLAYNNADDLSYWWLDSYLDFGDAQAPQVRSELRALHRWHRHKELPLYADLLAELQQQAAGSISATQMCLVIDKVQGRATTFLEQLGPHVWAIAPSLDAEQIRHLGAKFEKRNLAWREKWLDPAPAKREVQRLRRWSDDIERLYGRLSEAQKTLLRDQLAQDAFVPELIFEEIRLRQQDIVRTLSRAPIEERGPQAINALLMRLQYAPDPVHRKRQEKSKNTACRVLAALHNSSSASQRRHLIEALKGYEDDARVLAAADR